MKQKGIGTRGRRLVLAACLCLLLGGLCACAEKEGEAPEVSGTMAAYAPEQIGSAVRLSAYTGMAIELKTADAPKGEAVWQAVLTEAEILSYPEEQVSYYAEQTRAGYRYLAQRDGLTYEELLASLGVTEERILEEARQMVKGDLVYRYIVQDAGIALTEEEKATHFDRYAAKYVEDYGYTMEYVTEHLAEHVYDSMLYDKTMQYLIDRNTFTVVGD